MEIIDKAHDKIKKAPRFTTEQYIKFMNTREIYISAAAANEYGLSNGLFCHFVNDKDRWYFYFDTNEDGFQLNNRSRSKEGSRDLSIAIFSAPFIRLFIERTHHSLPCKFHLKSQEAKVSGNHLIEILHHNPLEN